MEIGAGNPPLLGVAALGGLPGLRLDCSDPGQTQTQSGELNCPAPGQVMSWIMNSVVIELVTESA